MNTTYCADFELFFLNSESYENGYKRTKRMATAEHRNLKGECMERSSNENQR